MQDKTLKSEPGKPVITERKAVDFSRLLGEVIGGANGEEDDDQKTE